MTTPPQVFKNRVEALRYLQGKQIAIGQTKFYDDCAKFGMVQPDKTLRLCDLLAYIEQEFKRGPVQPVRDYAGEERQRQLDDLEMREKTARVLKLEREQRAEDDKWILKDESWAQQAALVGTLRDALRHHFHLGQSRLVHLAGADPARGPELYEGIEEIMSKAFNELVASGRVDVVFDGEGDEVAA